MPQDNMVICFEGIQRIYRNAIVRFLRSKMTNAFPNDFVERLMAPFRKEEWEKIKKDSAVARESGELGTNINDEFDLLSVNHFFNIFDKYYDYLINDGSQKGVKQSLLNWMREIKNLRDPLSHPSEEDFPFEDSFRLLDCARRILGRLQLMDDSTEIREIINKLLKQKSAEEFKNEPLEDQLPPKESIFIDFVGRDIEMRTLWEWFQDPVSRRWALAGEGGKGKTAIAYNFAFTVKMKAPLPYQTVLWLSAKRKRFKEGSTICIDEPDFFDIDSALSTLLKQYGWVDEVTLPTETKRKRVIELLNEFPALVVIDDIDSLEPENEDVIEFFSLQLPATRSKVLFTSRRTIFGMGGTTTHIAGFKEEDAIKFIISLCKIMDLDEIQFNKFVNSRIIKITEGSPLFIEDLLRLVASVNSVGDAIKMWEEKAGTEARRYALGRECELLSFYARQVLFAACICSSKISFAEIEAITGLPRPNIISSLQELQRLFLVLKPKVVEGEQRFEVNINTRSLVYDVYGGSDHFKRAESAYKAISGEIGERGSGAVDAIIRQAVLLIRASKYDEAEQLLLGALEKYPSRSAIMGILGFVYKSWYPPRLIDAREKFLRAHQLKSTSKEMYEQWIKMEIREKEWTRAAEAAEMGLKMIPNSKSLLYWAGNARSRLAKEFWGGVHPEKANKELEISKKYLEKAVKMKPEEKELDLNAEIYRALVLVFEQEGNSDELKKYFKKWTHEFPGDPDLASEWARVGRKFNL